jgi:hypothetical protein
MPGLITMPGRATNASSTSWWRTGCHAKGDDEGSTVGPDQALFNNLDQKIYYFSLWCHNATTPVKLCRPLMIGSCNNLDADFGSWTHDAGFCIIGLHHLDSNSAADDGLVAITYTLRTLDMQMPQSFPVRGPSTSWFRLTAKKLHGHNMLPIVYFRVLMESTEDFIFHKQLPPNMVHGYGKEIFHRSSEASFIIIQT